jgi:hypothetical protein
MTSNPGTSVVGSFLEGWRRVIRAPFLAGGVLVATLLCALPAAMVMRSQIEEHLGSSLEADRALGGWNAGWAVEFSQATPGLAKTFTHEILGFGGTMAIANGFIENLTLNPAIAAAAAAYVAVWVFLSGGILDRLARGRPVRTSAFFSACGVYFFRFVRLGLVIGPAYWALFRWLHPYLFHTVYDRFTRDMTDERSAIALRSGLYGLFLGALMVVSLVADYAKVRAVVEDRRSMIGALAASLRFIRRRPVRTAGLYLLNAIALLQIVRVWFDAAPTASALTWSALLVTQVYLLFRLWAKLGFMASEVVFFQGELAHAGYTAAPVPVWPESPAAEAIGNLSRLRQNGMTRAPAAPREDSESSSAGARVSGGGAPRTLEKR